MTKRTIHSKDLFRNNILPENFESPIIIGYNIKTPENIGNIIRLGGNIACKEIIIVSDSENVRTSKIKKTASSSFDSVKWSFCLIEELKNKIPSDYEWIAIETASDSVNIYKTELPKKAAFIVGNELSGVDHNLLDRCNKIVHIPVNGNNKSLNVSHSLAIALFEWQRQNYL